MSRLYMTTKSDLRKGTGRGASEKCIMQVNWGSAKDSKLAAEIEVEWKKGSSKPYIRIKTGNDGDGQPLLCTRSYAR